MNGLSGQAGGGSVKRKANVRVIKRWGAADIKQRLNSCYVQAGSRYNDGFTAWDCKKDLIDVKYALDRLLEKCPTFAGESEYIEELENLKMWNKLSNE